MKPILAACFFLLLAVPFHPDWQDYEVARRGLLLCMLAGMCWPQQLWPQQTAKAALPLLLLCLWAGIRSFGATNAGYAWQQCFYLCALTLLFILGSQQRMEFWLRAILPTGMVVSLFGLLQLLGLPFPANNSQAISSLGNLNVAAELQAMAGAAAALLFLQTQSRRSQVLALWCLFLCACGVVANTSLSGLIALPLACGWSLAKSKSSRRRKGGLVLCLLLGLALGSVFRIFPEDSSTQEVQVTNTETPPAAPSTIAVRLALWQGGLHMLREEPALGHGNGQFRVFYPKYRTAEEIELSSHGRRFLASPSTAHNDYLELGIELGLPALLLLAWFALRLRRHAALAQMGPLLAFAFLAAIRSPLGNAPVAAFAFLLAGAVLQQAPVIKLPHRRWLWLLSPGLLWAGASQFGSQCLATDYVQQARQQQAAKALPALDRALWCHPFDHNLLSARAGLQLQSEDIKRLGSIAPHDTLTLLLLAEYLRNDGKLELALKTLATLLEQDPGQATARLRTAEILLLSGQLELALEALYVEPPQILRQGLQQTLLDLAAAMQERGDETMAKELQREAAFVESLDLLRDKPGSITTDAAIIRFVPLCEANDLRPMVLLALQALAMKNRDLALEMARAGEDRRLQWSHLQLLKPWLKDLQSLQPWQELLVLKGN